MVGFIRVKVWHITRTLHGGAGIYALRLSNALCDAGVESIVLCADARGDNESGQLVARGGPVSRLATRVVRSLSHRLTHAPYHSMMSFETCVGEQMPGKGDIVHLHGLTGWMGLKGLNALIPDESPVFWTTHDLWPLSGGCVLYAGCDLYRKDCTPCPIMSPLARGWPERELKMKTGFVRQRKVQPVANSAWVADLIQSSRVFQESKDVSIIPPIVDAAYFADEIENIREKLQIKPEKKVIALGARAVTDRYKGIPEFLTALAGRPALAEKSVVLVMGEGQLESPENLDARLLGRLNSAEEIAKIYHSSDVFVSPSAMETFGMALVEAQACGTPVAAFDVGGVRDAVSPECEPYLVANGDMEGLLNAVESIEGRVDRKWAQERFEASVIAKRQLNVYSCFAEVPGS